MTSLDLLPGGTPRSRTKTRFDVLVVEDEPTMREQLALALQDEGYSVTTAANGAAALELLGDADVRLVVLDLMLPVMNGREFCRALREDARLSDLPVVMITAVKNVHMAPPGPVYLKPIHRESFLRAVKLHMQRATQPGTS
jgi:CheY-like chemotaxis protein